MLRHPIRTVRALRVCAALLFRQEGYLGSKGWFRSLIDRSSVDAKGEPIPWITYPCIRFLESRLKRDMRVFEFGSGSSTIWWARMVERVVSCEHDREWFEQTRARAPTNAQVMHASREGHAYSNKILEYVNEFDIVVIDGRDRVRCARNAIHGLKSTGVIVWDNSDRDYYQPGFDFLAANGFRRVDFFGMSPLVPFECSTAILYRNGNCLGL